LEGPSKNTILILQVKTKSTIKDEEELNRTLQDIVEHDTPKLDFPAHCQINTRAHLKKFAPKEVYDLMDRKMRRAILILENFSYLKATC
jgi:hypothetical protein